jgi:hypothetical protein
MKNATTNRDTTSRRRWRLGFSARAFAMLKADEDQSHEYVPLQAVFPDRPPSQLE